MNKSKKINWNTLPFHLKKKYKNSIVFEEDTNLKSNKFSFDLKKLRQRKVEKEKTIEQKLQEFKINPMEAKYLSAVFHQLAEKHNYEYFTKDEVNEVLHKMELKMTDSEIDLMIWQFDETLNKKISQKQFINMYKKCTINKNGAQFKNLFHLIQFLMYCRPQYYKITVEDTLMLLYIRAKKQAQISKIDEKILLEEQIEVIFGKEEKTAEGVDKEIGFKQYLSKINKRAIEKRKEQILKAKANRKY